MSNITIIGSGPAGISAALYVARSGHRATVISMGSGALEKAHLIDNYYGFPGGITGADLEKNGVEQAKKLGVDFIEAQVTSIDFNGKYVAVTSEENIEGDAMILATGSPRKSPRIKGLKDFEGAGVSYCAVCDGFFHKGKDVAVLGNGAYAFHEAEALLPIANSVTLLSDGKELEGNPPKDLIINKEKITEIKGQGVINAVAFENGNSINITGLFVAQGSAGSGELALKLGALVEGSNIVVNEKMETSLPGLYSAGDSNGGMYQICKAVYEGAVAATSAIKYIKENK